MHRHDIADHTHDHAFLGHAHASNERRTWWVVALTAVMMVAEIAAGYIFNSMALLADGWHMATHAGALGVTAAAYAFARRRAGDVRFGWGTGKVGDLAGFASALGLGAVSIGIGIESVERLIDPGRVAFREAIVVAVIGLLVNLVSAWLLAGGGHHHGHGHHGHDGHGHSHGHDNNLRSAYLHVLADALTSVLAIAALVAGLWFGITWLDSAVGIIGAVVIARWSWGLAKDTASVLTDTVPDAALADTITAAIESDGDARIADMHLWQVGPGKYAAIVSLVAERPLPPTDYKARLAGQSRIAHLTVEANRCPDHGCGAGEAPT
ncbi:CDF family Co(II)/Ni(II) efflux transporter DmeF [Allosphingosinicella indica]|uniref:Cation diffusion facilitator family transporter n=1 Tax=Allosphingosinicella indica TaxID=941907 RepID=A0A1X7GEV1_9SPHN|nr:CDF family Co(II)/Ni(II) efflux transporter DmeF [Allosphingosinicella indica]SMF68242.1 cation diffusion facilitator family transporter [Allosphingosinicella indica]